VRLSGETTGCLSARTGTRSSSTAADVERLATSPCRFGNAEPLLFSVGSRFAGLAAAQSHDEHADRTLDLGVGTSGSRADQASASEQDAHERQGETQTAHRGTTCRSQASHTSPSEWTVPGAILTTNRRPRDKLDQHPPSMTLSDRPRKTELKATFPNRFPIRAS